MYLQTVMLLRAEGLHICPQMAWSQVGKTVAKIVSPPPDLIVYCGLLIGYEDKLVDQVLTGRVPLKCKGSVCYGFRTRRHCSGEVWRTLHDSGMGRYGAEASRVRVV